jgi:hypothetical protein
MTTFTDRLSAGITEATATRDEYHEGVLAMEERMRLLTKYRDGTADLSTPSIKPTGYPEEQGQEWVVWIPPFAARHFEGENILGPFGDTYWRTLEEATTFLAETLAWLDAGEPDTMPESVPTIESVGLLSGGKYTGLPLPAEGNVYHEGEWAIGYDEESTPEAWWIELELGRTDPTGETTDFFTEQVLSLSDVEALGLAESLHMAVIRGRKEFS